MLEPKCTLGRGQMIDELPFLRGLLGIGENNIHSRSSHKNSISKVWLWLGFGFMSIARDQTLQNNLTTITLNNLKSNPGLAPKGPSTYNIGMLISIKKSLKSKSHHGYHTELLTVYWLPSNCQLMRIYVYVTQIHMRISWTLAGSNLYTGIFDLMLTLVCVYPF